MSKLAHSNQETMNKIESQSCKYQHIEGIVVAVIDSNVESVAFKETVGHCAREIIAAIYAHSETDAQPVPVEPKRVPYTPEAWAMAEWAIPPHVHPIGSENWDVVNCAGDWKPPTPDQVRGYIAQAVYKFQKENVNPLNQKIDTLRAYAVQKDVALKVAQQDRDNCYTSLDVARRRLHEIEAFVTGDANDYRINEKLKDDEKSIKSLIEHLMAMADKYHTVNQLYTQAKERAEKAEAALQRAQEELDKWKELSRQIKTDWIPANQRLAERAEKAEQANRRMVELMKEPSDGMWSAVWASIKVPPLQRARSVLSVHDLRLLWAAFHQAMSAELLKEVE